MAAIRLLLLGLLPAFVLSKVRWDQSKCFSCLVPSQPQYSSSGIPANVLDGLPSQTFYQPEKSPNIPILPGERSEFWNTASSRWSSWKVGERRCCYHITVLNSGLQRGGLTAFFQDATTTTMGRWCPALWGPGSPPSPTPPQRATMENTREREGPPGHGEQYNQECSLVTESQINWLQISKSFSYG